MAEFESKAAYIVEAWKINAFYVGVRSTNVPFIELVMNGSAGSCRGRSFRQNTARRS